MHNVNISLCTETHPIAQKMGNFSAWVRSKLKVYGSGADEIAVSECSSTRLLAVVLGRHQLKTGFYDDAMALCLLEAIERSRQEDNE